MEYELVEELATSSVSLWVSPEISHAIQEVTHDVWALAQVNLETYIPVVVDEDDPDFDIAEPVEEPAILVELIYGDVFFGTAEASSEVEYAYTDYVLVVEESPSIVTATTSVTRSEFVEAVRSSDVSATFVVLLEYTEIANTEVQAELILGRDFVTVSATSQVTATTSAVTSKLSTAQATQSTHVFVATTTLSTAQASSVTEQYLAYSAYELVESSTGAEYLYQADVTSIDLLVAHANASTQLISQVASTPLLEVFATASALAWIPSDVSAWLMVPESTAMTTYSGWDFLDMVQDGDTVYAVGHKGICVVDADDDAGTPISAIIDWGFVDFDTPKTKRIDNIWVGYTADTPMRARVEVYESGSHTYDMPEKPARNPVNNRIRIGKRLVGRYWRVALTNTSGGDFTMNSIAVDTLATGRRV